MIEERQLGLQYCLRSDAMADILALCVSGSQPHGADSQLDLWARDRTLLVGACQIEPPVGVLACALCVGFIRFRLQYEARRCRTQASSGPRRRRTRGANASSIHIPHGVSRHRCVNSYQTAVCRFGPSFGEPRTQSIYTHRCHVGPYPYHVRLAQYVRVVRQCGAVDYRPRWAGRPNGIRSRGRLRLRLQCRAIAVQCDAMQYDTTHDTKL
jgi:hypothetical protein